MPKVLIVEDEAPIREELMDWMLFEGFDVMGAADGRAALALIEDTPPDLIVSDIRMPEMDGFELLLEIRSDPQLAQIPFIFLTASAERASVRKGMDTGADDYLTKPFTHAEVLQAIHSRLQKKAAQDARIKAQVDAIQQSLGEEREKRMLRTRLVAMFSHDFRNTMSSILSSSEILRRYDDRLSVERKHQHLERIDRAVHMLKQMLDDMLLAAELEEGFLIFAPQKLDLTDFVAQLVEELDDGAAPSHRIRFVGDEVGLVEADPKLIRQVLVNLISNSVKYSPEGSQIDVELRSDAHTLALSVEDRGIGIPSDSLSRVFEPFFRAENTAGEEGTGLGMSIVKTCVDLHDGHIRVDSTEGRGTRVVVDIPRR